MRRAWVPMLAWGALLLAWAAVQLLFTPSPGELGLLGGAGAFWVIVGGAFLVAERRADARGEPPGGASPLPDASAPAALLALGLAVLVVGWELGPWAMYLGGGIVVIALGSLVRERRAQKR